VPAWLSDALCRLSTGGGFATRELYTDQDEIIFDAMRPVMLTSIEEVATRGDLLDRCLIVWLPAIPEEERRREEEIVTAFEEVQPQIFGALLDALSGALRELPNTTLTKLPRMADFALWVHRHDGASSTLTQPIRGHDTTEVQNGAESCDFNACDADDANDANLQLQMAGWDQNGVGYEEGEL